MTAETEAPSAVLEVVICPSCGTLYRRTAERIWCPNCSADAPEGFDLGGLIDAVQLLQDGLDALVGAFAAGLRVELADVLAVLPKALETLVVPAPARPPAGRSTRTVPNRAPGPARSETPTAKPGQSPDGTGVDAAAAEPAPSGGEGPAGDAAAAAAAEPEPET